MSDSEKATWNRLNGELETEVRRDRTARLGLRPGNIERATDPAPERPQLGAARDGALGTIERLTRTGR